MSYLPYIVGAYAVFGAVIAWDGLSPLLKHGRMLRAIRRKGERAAAKNSRRDDA